MKQHLRKYVKAGPFFVEVLACIRYGWAKTDRAIVKRLDSNLRFVASLTKRLAAAGLIRPIAWELSGTHWVAVWGYGPGKTVPHPNGRALAKPRLGAEVLAFSMLWSELAHPTTSADLTEASGYGRVTTNRILRHARDLRMVRVGDWQTPAHGGAMAPMYVLGGKADEPKPAPQSRSDMQRAYAARVAEKRRALRITTAIFGRAQQSAGTPA